MDRYQVSGSENGPWFELTVTNNPVQALARGRASFEWPVVWVAKMRLIRGGDILPSKEVLFGDLEEFVSVKHGSAMADALHQSLNAKAYRRIEAVLTGHLVEEGVTVLVPDIKHRYGKDQAVRPHDFSVFAEPPAKKKISLKDLLDE